MGQARRRREQLGDQYGTAEASNRQARLEADALRQITRAMAEGVPVLMLGTTSAAGALAQTAGLPWLHELPKGAPHPSAVAWDWERDRRPEPAMFSQGVVVLGPGSAELMNDPATHATLRATHS